MLDSYGILCENRVQLPEGCTFLILKKHPGKIFKFLKIGA